MAYIHGPRHVFVCRKGHVSIEAYGSPDHYRCKKLVRTEDVDGSGWKINWHPCRKKTLILEREFARSIYGRGWKARNTEVEYLNRYMAHWLQQMLSDVAEA